MTNKSNKAISSYYIKYMTNIYMNYLDNVVELRLNSPSHKKVIIVAQ